MYRQDPQSGFGPRMTISPETAFVSQHEVNKDITATACQAQTQRFDRRSPQWFKSIRQGLDVKNQRSQKM